MISKISKFKGVSFFGDRRKIEFSRAAVVGLVAGLLALGFHQALLSFEHLRSVVLESIKTSSYPGPLLLVLFTAACGSFAAWLTVRFAPEATGSGIPHTKAAILHLRAIRWARLITVKFIAGVVAIGGGFSLGREGPTVQLGAAAGQFISELFKVPRRVGTHLIACGAGAGLAAAFNAPLAGFIFVIEELRRELSPLTYGTALIAAVFADMLTRVAIGASPSFDISFFPAPSLKVLPMMVILGIVTGFTGVLFNISLLSVLSKMTLLRPYLPRWIRAGLIGAVVGLVGWYLPDTLGSGHHAVEKFLHLSSLSEEMVAYVALILLAKFVLTVLCYSSGVPGGIFAPLLVQGALQGLLIGHFYSVVFNDSSVSPATVGVIAMASYFSAIVRAPLTGVILIVELTGNYNLLFLLLVSSLISYLVAEWTGQKPIYESLLEYNLKQRAPKESQSDEPVLLDVVIEPGSNMDGRALRDLSFPQGCLVVTIYSHGEKKIPSGSSVLSAGDRVTVLIEGHSAQLSREVQSLARA